MAGTAAAARYADPTKAISVSSVYSHETDFKAVACYKLQACKRYWCTKHQHSKVCCTGLLRVSQPSSFLGLQEVASTAWTQQWAVRTDFGTLRQVMGA